MSVGTPLSNSIQWGGYQNCVSVELLSQWGLMRAKYYVY